MKLKAYTPHQAHPGAEDSYYYQYKSFVLHDLAEYDKDHLFSFNRDTSEYCVGRDIYDNPDRPVIFCHIDGMPRFKDSNYRNGPIPLLEPFRFLRDTVNHDRIPKGKVALVESTPEDCESGGYEVIARTYASQRGPIPADLSQRDIAELTREELRNPCGLGKEYDLLENRSGVKPSRDGDYPTFCLNVLECLHRHGFSPCIPDDYSSVSLNTWDRPLVGDSEAEIYAAMAFFSLYVAGRGERSIIFRTNKYKLIHLFKVGYYGNLPLAELRGYPWDEDEIPGE